MGTPDLPALNAGLPDGVAGRAFPESVWWPARPVQAPLAVCVDQPAQCISRNCIILRPQHFCLTGHCSATQGPSYHQDTQIVMQQLCVVSSRLAPDRHCLRACKPMRLSVLKSCLTAGVSLACPVTASNSAMISTCLIASERSGLASLSVLPVANLGSSSRAPLWLLNAGMRSSNAESCRQHGCLLHLPPAQVLFL